LPVLIFLIPISLAWDAVIVLLLVYGYGSVQATAAFYLALALTALAFILAWDSDK
jgi:hypothetical protein